MVGPSSNPASASFPSHTQRVLYPRMVNDGAAGEPFARLENGSLRALSPTPPPNYTGCSQTTAEILPSSRPLISPASATLPKCS